MNVIKRTGEYEEFNEKKIESAIAKAMLEVGGVEKEVINHIIEKVTEAIYDTHQEEEHVEVIQDMIEYELMQLMPDVAKRYIIYRNKRQDLRNEGWVMDELQRAIWESKYQHDNETFDEWLERVSGGDQRIKKRMRNKEFLFGGRILSNRGLQHKGLKVTYSNCYVLPKPEDNLESIFDTARDMARTYSYGGGVGISIGNLRPRDSAVHNNAQSTSGAVSFMPIYSLTTETIGQKGRRGALMISIPSHHPDIEEFIDVKTQDGAITGANISIEIDNPFMIAVKEEKEYTLSFTVEDTGETIEKTVDAKALYRKIIENNWDWAEPGVLYWDRISNYHLMSADPDFKFDGTNPCAEEPLPPGGSCLLGSINLAEFVTAPFTENARFDAEKFDEVVKDATIALNDVLDEGLDLHPLDIQKKSVNELRQIGLGIMGLSDMLIKLGITYGSTKSLVLSEMISHIMLNKAVSTSADIAEERGVFSQYKWENIQESEFFQANIAPQIKQKVRDKGLRNSQILCIAPTGSISTMLGVSGGLEPIYNISFNRTTKSLHGEDKTYKVYTQIVKDWYKANNKEIGDELPEMFITAMTLGWKERIEMQAVWQKHIDASISSTINLPKKATVDETMDLYMYAWEMGLKGATIFRDGCKRLGILTNDEEEDTKEVIGETLIPVEGFYSTCPECGSENMAHEVGCVRCQDCGFSPC